MTDAPKRVNVERPADPEEKTKEGVVNDSLGTVDPADSTGLDDDQTTGQQGEAPGPED